MGLSCVFFFFWSTLYNKNILWSILCCVYSRSFMWYVLYRKHLCFRILSVNNIITIEFCRPMIKYCKNYNRIFANIAKITTVCMQFKKQFCKSESAKHYLLHCRNSEKIPKRLFVSLPFKFLKFKIALIKHDQVLMRTQSLNS